MKDLKSFINSKKAKGEKVAPSNNENAGNYSESKQATPEEILNAYGGKSKSELMNVLFSEVAKKRQDGTLSDGELDAFANQVAPMLDETSRRELFSLVNALKQ